MFWAAEGCATVPDGAGVGSGAPTGAEVGCPVGAGAAGTGVAVWPAATSGLRGRCEVGAGVGSGTEQAPRARANRTARYTQIFLYFDSAPGTYGRLYRVGGMLGQGQW